MDDNRRTVLERVADGSLTPEEALQVLDGTRADAGTRPPRRTPRDADRVTRLRVASELGVLSVIGDASVRDAVADGACSMRREGDTLVVTGDDDAMGSYRAVGIDLGRRRRVMVRANPELALELEIAAGKAQVSGMRGPLRAEVELGKLVVAGFEGPIDVTVAAGKVELSGRLDHGTSRVDCEIGKVDIHLVQGSHVRVGGRAELGTVKLPGGGRDVDGRVTIGDGTATLDVSTSAGAVVVRA